MASRAIPVKTPEGQAELASRRLRLSQRHRTVLLLVDGKRSEREVCQLAALAGVPATCFEELLGLSLIALPETAGEMARVARPEGEDAVTAPVAQVDAGPGPPSPAPAAAPPAPAMAASAAVPGPERSRVEIARSAP